MVNIIEYGRNNGYEQKIPYIMKKLDEINLKILCGLLENAKISNAELSRRIGIAQPSIAERIHRLEADGIISGYRPELDLKILGFPIQAILRISLMCDSKPVIKLAREIPEILECYRATGADCLILRTVAKSMEDLERITDRFVGFGQVTTSVILSTHLTPITTIKRLLEEVLR